DQQVGRHRRAAALKGRFDHLLVLGIGGSALGTKAVWEAVGGGGRGGLRLSVADNVDPDLFVPLLRSLPIDRTLVVAISKSGGTAETNAQLAIAAEALKKASGGSWKDHVVVVTDPRKGLFRKLAEAEGFVSYAVPPNVGGRFSVLSPVGLFPLAAAGISPERLLAGARWMDAVLRRPGAENPVLHAAAVYAHYMLANPKPVHVWFSYGAGLDRVAEWWQQLWAESLGKRRPGGAPVGQTPARAMGVTDQHSQLQLYQDGPADKVFTFVTWAEPRHDRAIPRGGVAPGMETLGGKPLSLLFRSESEGTVGALWKGGRPIVTIEIGRRDEEHVGALLHFWEWVTALVGTMAGIDPFDQPGVEASKVITRALMGDRAYRGQRRTFLADLRGRQRAEMQVRGTIPASAGRSRGEGRR
ncbi:MAG: glucose-6-phosphate isomerase, partial [Deltaproteobacteria bacterium]|nr:glucose-6-phosphate isomerase [Deltaproteobacteria bacterium]